MKKLISVLLSALMLFSLCSASVSAAGEKDELKIAVANDLHYNLSGAAANYTGSYTEDYQNALSSGQLRLESELIIEGVADSAETYSVSRTVARVMTPSDTYIAYHLKVTWLARIASEDIGEVPLCEEVEL